MKSKRKVFIEKIINSLLNILIFIFGIILLVSIYTSVQTKILGNNYPNFFGYSLFEVQTGSMADTINAGDCIVVKLTQKVKLNDIITYEQAGEFITHRVIEVYNGTFVTKGDANNAKDDPIDQNQIVGKVINILPNFGFIRRTMFNPAVLIALIVTLFLFNLAVKKNKKNDNKEEVTKSSPKALIKKGSSLLNKIKSFIKSKRIKEDIEGNWDDDSDDISKIENKVVENHNDTPKIESKVIESHEELPNLNQIIKTEYNDEDLDKTSLYRVVSVDSNEVDEKYKEIAKKVIEEDNKKEELLDSDMDKTLFYRIIPVDLSDIEDTRLEIAEREMVAAEQNDKLKEKLMKEEVKVEPEEVADDSLTKITLDMIKNKKGKKSKNIINTAMLIKEEELNELINILIEDEDIPVKKEIIKESFIKDYITAKYYNQYGDSDNGGKRLITKIEKIIKGTKNELISNNRNKDVKYNETIDIYADIFILIANLEQANEVITNSKVKEGFYRKKIIEYSEYWDSEEIECIINKIMEIQKKYIGILNNFLKNLDTSMFNLNFNKLTSKKDMFGLDLQHNIAFSRIYSDYIIDKTYTEGIIAEDKMSVLLTLLSVQLIKDMVLANFNIKYILYIPESLYTKEKKFEKILRMFDDEYAKENVIILIKFGDLLKNIQIVKKTRKAGYKFAITLDKETVIQAKNRGNIYIADYIFINKKGDNMDNLVPYIPEELLCKVIYEDISNKVGDFGGE